MTAATVGDAIRDAARRLAAVSIDEAQIDARLLVGLATGLDRTGLVTNRDRRLTDRETHALDEAVNRRLCHEPVSRIIDQREFWSLPFALSPDALDPRPDSETLVAEALRCLPTVDGAYRLLDLGTGSGCLLAALLTERRNAQGVGTDLAEGAAKIARTNLERLGLGERAQIVVGHWGDALNARFDLVVCNPPYIAIGERAALAPEVRDHDPALALFAGCDGLDAYRALAPRLEALLASGGTAILEIGAGQADAVNGLMANNGLETLKICADLAGIDRVLVVQATNPQK